MSQKQQELTEKILTDPAVESLSSYIGVDGINTTLNSGRILINLKPIEERDAHSEEIIHRLQSKISDINGIELYLQSIQDINVDDRISKHQYQFSVSSSNQEEVYNWSEKFVTELAKMPGIKDISSDVLMDGLQTKVDIDRSTAARLGITPLMIDNALYDAFGQRQISTIFTQVNQYHVILEAAKNIAALQNPFQHIFIISSAGKPIPLTTFTTISHGVGPLSINRQSQFPSSTISFNVKEDSSLDEAILSLNTLKKSFNLPDSVTVSLEGSAKIFKNSLSNEFFFGVCCNFYYLYRTGSFV